MAAGAGTPYITPQLLLSAPTGIAWRSIPGGANNTPSPAQNYAELMNICWRATSMVESYCGQQCRAIVHTEQMLAPDYWCTLPQGSNFPARVYTRRWPVLKVIGGQVSTSTSFPPVWTQVPATSFDIDYFVHGETTTVSQAPDVGLSANPILIAPGVVNWTNGRRGQRINVSYEAGWPMCGITQTANAGATSISVDDVTGFDVPGDPTFLFAQIYDDDQSELVQISSATATTPVTTSAGFTVNAGPGTLTLKTGTSLQFTHNRMNQNSPNNPTLITTMPEAVIWASVMFACSVAVTRGATASSIQALPGTVGRGGATVGNWYVQRAQELLGPYRHMA
jgi:hypothetical protein